MGSFRRRRDLGALSLLMVVAAACAAPPLEHGERAVHYDSIRELAASADAVAIGRVAQTSRGRVLDQEDVVFTIMNVRVAVEQLWAGRIPTQGLHPRAARLGTDHQTPRLARLVRLRRRAALAPAGRTAAEGG